MNLYWCETSDHNEDWFIVASSVQEACRLHEGAEGYNRGDARAILVRRIPKHLTPFKGWPDHDFLRALDAVFLSETTPRVVQIGSVVYQEGGMDAVIDRLSDDQSEAAGKAWPNKTIRLQ